MSGNISDEIKRIQDAKLNIKAAINEKGGTITNELIDKYPDAIRGLTSGGGEEDKWYVVSSFDNVLMNKGFAKGGTIFIPGMLNGKPVKIIGWRLFYYAGRDSERSRNDYAADLIIGEGIREIKDEAFYCSDIMNIKLPSTLRIIGEKAFYDVHWIKKLSLPDGLVKIGKEAFENNRYLTGPLIIPDSVTYIGDSAFSGCEFTELTLSKGLKTINSYSFLYNKLTNLFIPDNVTYIGYRAFDSNTLKTVSIPSTCTYNSSAFPSSAVITKREV